MSILSSLIRWFNFFILVAVSVCFGATTDDERREGLKSIRRGIEFEILEKSEFVLLLILVEDLKRYFVAISLCLYLSHSYNSLIKFYDWIKLG